MTRERFYVGENLVIQIPCLRGAKLYKKALCIALNFKGGGDHVYYDSIEAVEADFRGLKDAIEAWEMAGKEEA